MHIDALPLAKCAHRGMWSKQLHRFDLEKRMEQRNNLGLIEKQVWIIRCYINKFYEAISFVCIHSSVIIFQSKFDDAAKRMSPRDAVMHAGRNAGSVTLNEARLFHIYLPAFLFSTIF